MTGLQIRLFTSARSWGMPLALPGCAQVWDSRRASKSQDLRRSPTRHEPVAIGVIKEIAPTLASLARSQPISGWCALATRLRASATPGFQTGLESSTPNTAAKSAQVEMAFEATAVARSPGRRAPLRMDELRSSVSAAGSRSLFV